MSSEKKKGEKGRRLHAVLAGVLLSAAMLLLGVLLIEKEKIPPESFSVIATVCIALGAALAGKTAHSGKALICGIKSGGEYAAAVIIVLLAVCFEDLCWERIVVIIAVSLAFAVLGNLTNLCRSNKKFHKASLRRR